MDELALPLDDEPTFTVGELNRTIAAALVDAFPGGVWVRGEVSQLHTSRNGHSYFELLEKDDRRDDVRAVVRVALFRGDRPAVNRALRDAGVRLTEGVVVRIRGRVDYYPVNGRLQLVMHAIDPVFTVGRLAAERGRVLATLAADGLLGANAALELPLVPLRIGLVTSGGSAAFHDFVQELATSRYAFRVAHCDVRVQGAAAQRRIAWALRQLATRDLDVVAVVRGGGARSELAPFDSEVVARAIATMAVPVLTGIGHEVDRTVADEVAHTSVKTPTAVAATVVALVAGFDEQLGRVAHRLALRARSACGDAARDLSGRSARIRRRSSAVVAREHDSVGVRRRRVADLARVGVRAANRDVDTAEARLRALDPRRVVERGYAIVRDSDGRVVKDVAAVPVGAMLLTEIAGGRIRSRVEATEARVTEERT
jgi:exodeoxyribonuclease VII large subunit